MQTAHERKDAIIEKLPDPIGIRFLHLEITDLRKKAADDEKLIEDLKTSCRALDSGMSAIFSTLLDGRSADSLSKRESHAADIAAGCLIGAPHTPGDTCCSGR
jgi:hypothetical protein